MPKAKTIDRLELTKQKMAAREAFVTGLCTKEDLEKKKNSRFLQMVAEMKQEQGVLMMSTPAPSAAAK